jgi:two-component system cell cycle sensor histidine kinase/response regulator CckA
MNPGSGFATKAREVFRDVPIRYKVSLIIMAAIGFAILVAGSAVLVYESRTFKPRSLEKVETQADILSEILVPSLVFQDSATATEYLATLRYWKDIKGAAAYDALGNFFAGYSAETKNAGFPARAFPVPGFPAKAPETGARFKPLDLSYCAVISKTGEGRIGYLWLDLELLPLYARLPQYGIMFGVVTLSLAAVAVMLGFALKHGVSLPITALAGTARSVIDRKDYSLRATGHGKDEIGNLTEVFNQMLQGIEARDISLRNSEERFSKAFLASPIPISIVRIDSDVFIDSNDSNLALLGYTRQELIGRSAMDLGIVSLESRAFARKQMKDKGTIRNVKMQIRRKSGEMRDILLSMELIELGGVDCFLITSDDVSERIQAEEKLRQAQKMEAVGLLAGGIAHDFNNLLTAILGYSSMALEGLSPTHPLHRPLKQVFRAGERAEGLTKQLLAYSRKQVLEFKLWDLKAIVSDMEGMLKRLISEDIELTESSDSRPCLALVDRGQVEQIILNLALNARDAMPGGGKLILKTSVERLERSTESQLEAKPGNYAVLSVIDSGTGMTPEVKTRLFEPFFTTKEVGKGTGLGLSVVYGIVKQSGGTLSVASEPGRGTTFRIYFPEAGKDEGKPGTIGADEAEGGFRGKETILLVEDEAIVREYSRTVLEDRGYKVLEAANGLEALHWVDQASQSIDMVVTDVVMPDMGGRALADRLKEKMPDLPVLFLSGYSDDGFRDNGGLQPGEAFLQKPFTPKNLARAVREKLEKGKAADNAGQPAQS